MSVERERTYALAPYIRHIGNCGAADSADPTDDRCICGLRQLWGRHVLTSPACRQCDLSTAFASCSSCMGTGGSWVCLNLECPA